MSFPSLIAALVPCLLATLCPLQAADDWVEFEGREGPGAGKHLVFISGDEEYRSEECLPMLARMLSARHGFKCTVLFAVDPRTGAIAPEVTTNIPGLAALETADLMVIFTRFRQLPDEQMAHLDRYVQSGRPILGLRTATHAFAFPSNSPSRFAHYDWRSRAWPGGFGQQVLGETWVAHHGVHGKQSTRGVIPPRFQEHPILRGVTNLWGPTDVYAVKHLSAEAQVLVQGQVLTGMQPDDPPVDGQQNHPMMPLIWLRDFQGSSGATSKVLCSTLGSGPDFESEGLRRLFVNACYHLVGLAVPAKAEVRYVGEYRPRFFGFGQYESGVKPQELPGTE